MSVEGGNGRHQISINVDNWLEICNELHTNPVTPVWFKAVLSNLLGRRGHDTAFYSAILAQLMRCRRIQEMYANGQTLEDFNAQNRNILAAIDAGAIKHMRDMAEYVPAGPVPVHRLDLTPRGLHHLRSKNDKIK